MAETDKDRGVIPEISFTAPAGTPAVVEDPHAPVLHRPLPEDTAALRLAADHLTAEFHALGHLSLEIHAAALRHLLSVLVLRLAHLTAPAGSPTGGSHVPALP